MVTVKTDGDPSVQPVGFERVRVKVSEPSPKRSSTMSTVIVFEGSETFTLTLSNPIGCTLGSPSVFTVTIDSDEAVNGPNPVKTESFSNDFFVRQHYFDFLNRAPDDGGLAFWKAQIEACDNAPL